MGVDCVFSHMTAYSSSILTTSLLLLLCFFLISLLLTAIICLRWHYVISDRLAITKSCLYIGTVKHSRLKGVTGSKHGVVHQLQYPLFFSYLNLHEIMSIGWSLYPIFKVNAGAMAFCSLDEKDHLKGIDFTKEGNSSDKMTFLQKIHAFVKRESNGKLNVDDHDINLLTHLTYFGYCFNPVSFYYMYNNKNSKSCSVDAIIAEVGNTPWNEQHSYLLHEHVLDVAINRHRPTNPASDDIDTSVTTSDRVDSKADHFEATWTKCFHVSPFMEMDYRYNFTFSEPKDVISVHSKLVKAATNEVWFTAHFHLTRIPFTPLNLLYVLVFYPLHTRMIQIWIHLEALKIYLKGVPTFEHPEGTDVDFGWGVTGKNLIRLYEYVSYPVLTLWQLLITAWGRKIDDDADSKKKLM